MNKISFFIFLLLFHSTNVLAAVVLEEYAINYDDGYSYTITFDSAIYGDGSYSLQKPLASMSTIESCDTSLGICADLNSTNNFSFSVTNNVVSIVEFSFYINGLFYIEGDRIDHSVSNGIYGVYQNESLSYSVSQVPIPAASWLFVSALLGLTGIKRKK